MLILPALMPHGTCFFWNVPLTTLHAIADFLTFVAYFSIPAIMFANRHHVTEKTRPLLFMFAAFILSCGIGHLLAAWNIWHANYWLEGVAKLITALASGYTAIELARCLPSLLGTQKALEESEELVRTDPLTGLCNRRGLQETVAKLNQDKCDRIHTLILLDLDGFKTINDTYGHPFGDRILSRVGELLRISVRSSESLVARLGGDEFAILLENCNLEEATRVASRLRHLIATISIPEEHDRTLSVSAGLAMIARGIDLDTAYQNADKALYYSKHNGKNCVSWLDATQETHFQSL